jgi:hypothetical protein
MFAAENNVHCEESRYEEPPLPAFPDISSVVCQEDICFCLRAGHLRLERGLAFSRGRKSKDRAAFESIAAFSE